MTYTVKWSHEFKRNVKRIRFTANSRDAANATYTATGCLSIAKTETRAL